MKLSERIPHAKDCGMFKACICTCYVKEVAQLEADVVKLENEVIRLEDENDALSQLMNGINDELLVSEKKVDRYMKLAAEYIKAYENLAFGDAIMESEG